MFKFFADKADYTRRKTIKTDVHESKTTGTVIKQWQYYRQKSESIMVFVTDLTLKLGQ